ncbi:5426_t:CDS:2, partial [Gigaspora rosea]
LTIVGIIYIMSVDRIELKRPGFHVLLARSLRLHLELYIPY